MQNTLRRNTRFVWRSGLLSCRLLAKFKDICPGGMGYTVLPKPPVSKPVITYQEPVVTPRPLPLPTPEKPVEAFGEPDEPLPGEAEPARHVLLGF